MTVVNTTTGELLSSFDELETIIEQGLHTFIDVGSALAQIRDRRLYRDEFGNFEDYCQTRWGMDRVNAHRTIEAAEVVAGVLSIDNTAPVPANLGQARELAGVAPAPAADIMRVAHRATNGNLTAKAIREVREQSFIRQAEADVKEFPALTHYAAQGKTADVVRLAGALREYDEPERKRRIETLKKTIAFEQGKTATPDRHLSVAPTPPSETSEYAELAYSVVGLANELADFDVLPVHLAFAITDDSLEHIENAITFLSNLAAAVKEF